MYPILHILGREIGTYGVCALAGLIASAVLACTLAKRRGLMMEDIVLLVLTGGLGLVIGAHLLYGLTNLPMLALLARTIGRMPAREFFAHLGTAFGGMVFYGGLFGLFAAAYLHSKLVWSLNPPAVFDILAVAVPLFHTFGRVGCFFGGCCYGIECPVGFLVSENPVMPEVAGVTRLPVQLIEAAGNLALFALMLSLFLRKKHENRLIYRYLILYAIMRFLLEFLRGDVARGVWLGLSTSQWISAGIILWVGAAALRRRRAAL